MIRSWSDSISNLESLLLPLLAHFTLPSHSSVDFSACHWLAGRDSNRMKLRRQRHRLKIAQGFVNNTIHAVVSCDGRIRGFRSPKISLHATHYAQRAGTLLSKFQWLRSRITMERLLDEPKCEQQHTFRCHQRRRVLSSNWYKCCRAACVGNSVFVRIVDGIYSSAIVPSFLHAVAIAWIRFHFLIVFSPLLLFVICSRCGETVVGTTVARPRRAHCLLCSCEMITFFVSENSANNARSFS